jgi:dipeptidyl aminopeptidase/acylaminoacyl peptidase
MKRTLRSFACCAVSLLAYAPRASAQQDPRLARDQSVAHIRQPSSAVLSANGRMLAFVVGDSLLVASTTGRGAPRVVATGVRAESDPNAFLAWSPDARRLVVRKGWLPGSGAHPAAGVPVVVDIGTGAWRPLISDTLARQLETFRDWRAGGPRWSPDGRRVAFLAAPAAELGFSLHVYVAEVATGAVRRVLSRDAGNFSVAWSPDGRWLAFTTVTPGEAASTVELLDARTLDVTTGVATWRQDAGPLRELLWSPSGRLLLAQDGTGRPLLLAVDSSGIGKPATHALPALLYRSWLGDSALLGTLRSGMSDRVVVVNRASGARTALTGPDTSATPIGVGYPGGSGDAVVAYTPQSGSLPADIWVGRLSRTARLHSTRNISALNPGIAQRTLPRTVIYRWTSGAGDTLDAQLLLPWRAGGRRPLVVVPYGGYRNRFPQSDYFLERGFLSLLDRDYAVVLPNTRGTDTDHLDQGRYGAPQLEDTERLIEALSRDGFIDQGRVAVLGHSHGGSMVYYYLTHSSAFCAGIAVSGRADWVLQAHHGDGLLPDILGGAPEAIPEVYAAFSPAANARRASAPLLAVAGMHDTQILPANVPIMADSMRAAGKRIETLVFEDEGHVLEQERNIALFWLRAHALLDAACHPSGASPAK